MNAYWRSIIVDLDSLSDGFEFEIQAAARAARTGLRTMEISCYEAPRVGGHSKLSPMRDGWFILLLLLNEAKPRTPTSFRACADWHLGKDDVIDLRLDPPSPSITLLETAV